MEGSPQLKGNHARHPENSTPEVAQISLPPKGKTSAGRERLLEENGQMMSHPTEEAGKEERISSMKMNLLGWKTNLQQILFPETDRLLTIKANYTEKGNLMQDLSQMKHRLHDMRRNIHEEYTEWETLINQYEDKERLRKKSEDYFQYRLNFDEEVVDDAECRILDIDRRINCIFSPVVIPPFPHEIVTGKLNQSAPAKVSKMDQSPSTSVEMFKGTVGNQIGARMSGDTKKNITPMVRVDNYRNPMDSRSTCVLDASSQMEKRKESSLVIKVVLPNTTDTTGEQAQNKGPQFQSKEKLQTRIADRKATKAPMSETRFNPDGCSSGKFLNSPRRVLTEKAEIEEIDKRKSQMVGSGEKSPKNQVGGDNLTQSRDPVKKVCVKSGDKIQRVGRIIRSGIIQAHKHENLNPCPQIRLESGPRWSQAMRGWTVPWDPGEWTQSQGAPPIFFLQGMSWISQTRRRQLAGKDIIRFSLWLPNSHSSSILP